MRGHDGGAARCSASRTRAPRTATCSCRNYTASVKDGAVGVAVDDPVTVAAEGGVLGAVTMTNQNGSAVEGS